MSEHKRFTVAATAYLRSADLSETHYAIHYQAPPVTTERGTSMGMRWPTFIVANYVEDPEGVAEKVAAILEAHWSDDHDQ